MTSKCYHLYYSDPLVTVLILFGFLGDESNDQPCTELNVCGLSVSLVYLKRFPPSQFPTEIIVWMEV